MRERLSYRDAELWATARVNQIDIVVSEDFQDGGLDGVQFENPFASALDLARLIESRGTGNGPHSCVSAGASRTARARRRPARVAVARTSSRIW